MQTEKGSRKEASRRYYLKHRDKILERNKRWQENNPDKLKEIWKRANRKAKYGLAQDDFDQLFVAQNNACAICKTTEASWCVDHCHSTGKVRGILCNHCNTGLGMFKDAEASLTNALHYLRRHNLN